MTSNDRFTLFIPHCHGPVIRVSDYFSMMWTIQIIGAKRVAIKVSLLNISKVLKWVTGMYEILDAKHRIMPCPRSIGKDF